MTEYPRPLEIWRCCRDWPIDVLTVYATGRLGRCGYCGERPTKTDKTLDEYMAERQKETPA